MPENRVISPLRQSLAAALAVAAMAFLFLIPSAHARTGTVVWAAPTQADRSHFAVTTGAELTLRLTASTSVPLASVRIKPVGGLPRGAVLDSSSKGRLSRAFLRWTPAKAGSYVLRFAASNGHGASAPTLTYLIEVKARVQYPRSSALIDARVAHRAAVLKLATVYSKPSESARIVTMLSTTSADSTPNIVLVLAAVERSATEKWYKVRLTILPNNSTGWVPARFLGKVEKVHTHLYVDRAKLTATLERDGRPIFTTIVGVGHDYWPTPRGEFYIVDKLTNMNNPVYGPVAFGTSARSAALTDWPGGGYVGVHGTNQPQILPGQVSHGCIRMPNESILKLERLMELGTPLTVR